MSVREWAQVQKVLLKLTQMVLFVEAMRARCDLTRSSVHGSNRSFSRLSCLGPFTRGKRSKSSVAAKSRRDDIPSWVRFDIEQQERVLRTDRHYVNAAQDSRRNVGHVVLRFAGHH